MCIYVYYCDEYEIFILFYAMFRVKTEYRIQEEIYVSCIS